MAAPRIKLATICNSLPPYRVHVNQRIVREMKNVQLYSVCTFEGMDARWKHAPPPQINPVDFGKAGDGSRHAMDLASYRKGGQIIEWMRREGVNAVVVFGYNDALRIRIIRWCDRQQIPCFVWGDSNIRGDFATGIKRKLKHLLVGWVMMHVTGVFPCGELGAQFFERYGARRDQIFYFPNEPDYALIQLISDEQIAATLARFGLDRQRRRIVFSGRLVRAKNPDHLIKAFLHIAAHRPSWDLLMVGDGPMRQELVAAVPAEFATRVQWTGFLDDQPAISALYRGSDVLCLPAGYEPWALVINEAAAAGMAIVCSDVVGAAPELVREGENGWTYPPGDIDALTTKLLAVTDNSTIDGMKAASLRVLSDWQRKADPVDGLRKALASVGLDADAG